MNHTILEKEQEGPVPLLVACSCLIEETVTSSNLVDAKTRLVIENIMSHQHNSNGIKMLFKKFLCSFQPLVECKSSQKGFHQVGLCFDWFTILKTHLSPAGDGKLVKA